MYSLKMEKLWIGTREIPLEIPATKLVFHENLDRFQEVESIVHRNIFFTGSYC
jgi:hypothetical protein